MQRTITLRTCLTMALLLAASLAVACGSSGLPDHDGSYPIQGHSVTWDGNQYKFQWADTGGNLHQAQSSDVQLLQDDQEYLQVQNHKGILHLLSTDPVNVLGRDQGGEYRDPWFPFLAGAALGSTFGGSRTPAYYYPPTVSYGRGDQIDGSITNTAPKPPDYSSVKTPPNAVHPADGAVSGQSSGTGGGNAATNKLGGSGAAGAPATGGGATSGQNGGAGAGSAAGNKGSAAQSGNSGGGRAGGGSSAPRSAPSSGGSRSHR